MRTAPGGTGVAAVAAAANCTAMRHKKAKAIRCSRFDTKIARLTMKSARKLET